MTSWPGGAVVVGIDGSASALDATRWAAAEAVLRGTALRLVAAVAWTSFRPVGVPALGQEYQRRVLERQALEHLATAAAVAREAAPQVQVEEEVRGGEPPVVLRDESRHAAVVVLGTRGRGGFGTLLLGSVALGVAAHAECPVAVVRGTAVPDGPVVVGLGEAPDDAPLAVAFEEAGRRGVPLTVVSTYSQAMLDPFLVPLLDREGLLADQLRQVRERIAAWVAKYPGVTVTVAAELDGAARELVARSAEAALVVVGSHGRGPLSGPLLGSVSQAVLQHAACPVMVVRPEAAR